MGTVPPSPGRSLCLQGPARVPSEPFCASRVTASRKPSLILPSHTDITQLQHSSWPVGARRQGLSPVQNVLNPNLTLSSPQLKSLPPWLPTALRIECMVSPGPRRSALLTPQVQVTPWPASLWVAFMPLSFLFLTPGPLHMLFPLLNTSPFTQAISALPSDLRLNAACPRVLLWPPSLSAPTKLPCVVKRSLRYLAGIYRKQFITIPHAQQNTSE